MSGKRANEGSSFLAPLASFQANDHKPGPPTALQFRVGSFFSLSGQSEGQRAAAVVLRWWRRGCAETPRWSRRLMRSVPQAEAVGDHLDTPFVCAVVVVVVVCDASVCLQPPSFTSRSPPRINLGDLLTAYPPGPSSPGLLPPHPRHYHEYPLDCAHLETGQYENNFPLSTAGSWPV